MGENIEKNSSMDCLVIKTGIPIYRSIILFSSFCFFVAGCYCLIYDNANVNIFFLLGLALLPLVFFVNKIVIFLHLPTNYLYVTKDEFILRKRKKQLVFKINKIKFSFHPFSFETPSTMLILKCKKSYEIFITKKQFTLIEEFLNNIEE